MTPKDFMPHFKLVLHGALFTRDRNQEAPSCLCRLGCGYKETIPHLGECSVLRPIYLWLNTLAECKLESQQEAILGIPLEGPPLPPAANAFYLIVMKSLLISFCLVDLENKKFSTEEVKKFAICRMAKKVQSYSVVFQRRVRRAKGRGDRPPSPESANKQLCPLAKLDETGVITWSEKFKSELDAYELTYR